MNCVTMFYTDKHSQSLEQLYLRGLRIEYFSDAELSCILINFYIIGRVAFIFYNTSTLTSTLKLLCA